MKLQILAGAAALALIAGGASAATHHRHGVASLAEPSQPVAYSKLAAYLKASPREKASGSWGLDTTTAAAAAPTGTSANTSATAQAPGATTQGGGQAGMMPDNSAPPAASADTGPATTAPPAPPTPGN